MNQKPLTYSLVGLLTGSMITAAVLSVTAQSSPQTSAPTTLTDRTILAQAPAGSTTPTPPVGTASPVPSTPGMMGQSDQHFIVMMIPHHEGAIAMAELALSKAKHPEIKKLAESIKTTQSQEIQQMQTWYKQWFAADVPAWGPGSSWGWYNRNQPGQGSNQRPVWGPGMGMYRNWDDWDQNGLPGMMGGGMMSGGMMSGGMMSGGMMGGGMMGTDLDALQNTADFDREFIQQMIPHHQMGVMMAAMVINSSQRPEIQNLAQSIIKSQTAEINQMQQWYQEWYQ